MPVKINIFEAENVKRIKAVKMEPSAAGLTIIGGDNNQGKTSVLDTIIWALGGEDYRPSTPQREGSVIPPYVRLVMSNGLIVERKGKNSDLKVTDPEGRKAGQTLLNEFTERLALNLPRFMQSNNREKAETLLQIIGVGAQLRELEQKEQQLYNRRLEIGRIADQKEKYAKEQTYYPDAPKEPVSASKLIRQQQDILAKNGENQRKRNNLSSIRGKAEDVARRVDEARAKLLELTELQNAVRKDLEIAQRDALDLQDENTDELERNISDIDAINRKVRANLDREKAEEDARQYREQCAGLTADIDAARKAKMDLLAGAPLPLPGLSVEDSELTYNGRKWDCISGSDQLKVATAIVRKLNPQCGFVLLDKLEQMDLKTLHEFGDWLEAEGLQAIATRVSTGDECSIIIEDGYVVGAEQVAQANIDAAASVPIWRTGEF
jgi:DNA repair exonuclease SbcCD ATPase subunit